MEQVSLEYTQHHWRRGRRSRSDQRELIGKLLGRVHTPGPVGRVVPREGRGVVGGRGFPGVFHGDVVLVQRSGVQIGVPDFIHGSTGEIVVTSTDLERKG